MSVQALLSAAMIDALRGAPGVADAVTGIFDAPPVRAARPYALVEDAVLGDWGTKDMAGRDGRVAVLLYDGGERPVRLRTLAGEAEAAIDAMPRDLGEGWRVVTLVLARSRIVREGEGSAAAAPSPGRGKAPPHWAAMIEWRVRMLRES